MNICPIQDDVNNDEWIMMNGYVDRVFYEYNVIEFWL
jgi:hypothetical protein